MDRLTERGIPRIHKNNDKKESEHILDVPEEKKEEDKREASRWVSFCFDIHPESSKFFAKLFVSLIVISLCFYQLINVEDCGSQHMYSGLLGIILGAYLK